MRDLFVTAVIFASLPFILYRPYIGVLVWTWLAYMNPHKLAWGFATEMPFALIIAVTTLFAFFISREPKKIPWTRETIVLVLFTVWMFITTWLSLYPELAWPQWDKVWKIQLMTLITLMLMSSKARLNLLIWVIVLSLGFYGVKGGIWVLSTGGAHRVLGPMRSFIGGNNEIGLALIMTVPLMRYLQLNVSIPWIRYALTAAIVLTCIAVLGTHSRGALVGIVAMALFLLLKSRRRLVPLLIVGLMIAIAPRIMPEKWFDRMETIETYREDKSAMERLRAWGNAYDLASKRLLGGGYNVLIVYGERDAHSIYFEVMGEHGFIGFSLYILLGFFTWRSCTWIIRKTKKDPTNKWAADLAAMIQVSLVGFGAAGAFLGLAYFDLSYLLVAIVVLAKLMVKKSLAEAEDQQAVDLHAVGPNPIYPYHTPGS
ncbi:MAG: putative O-glycosylation ligase, exosortase A system-associated, partial [Gammaproteobacteria bacterium]|nr:putative O-glycosylation ligase, exosortase A system-associated [Gammaproteobacteria bacterium]